MDRDFVEKRPVAVGMIPDGRTVQISEIETREPMRGHDQRTHIAVDVGAGAGAPAASFGFLTFEDAMRFVTTYDVQDYKGYDASGRETVTARHGLGCPESLLSRRGKLSGELGAGGDAAIARVASFDVSGSRAGMPAGVPGTQPKTPESSGSAPILAPVVTVAPATLATESVPLTTPTPATADPTPTPATTDPTPAPATADPTPAARDADTNLPGLRDGD